MTYKTWLKIGTLSALILLGCGGSGGGSSDQPPAQPKKIAVFFAGGSFTGQPEDCTLNPNAVGLPEIFQSYGYDFRQLCYEVPASDVLTPIEMSGKLHVELKDYDEAVLIGSSAGATIAYAALVKDPSLLEKIHTFIGYYGVYNFDTMYQTQQEGLAEYLIDAYVDSTTYEASPVNMERPTVDIFLYHSMEDEMVPYNQSTELCDPCTYLSLTGAHGEVMIETGLIQELLKGGL